MVIYESGHKESFDCRNKNSSFYTYVKVGRVGLGIGLGVRLLAFLMVTPWQKNSNR